MMSQPLTTRNNAQQPEHPTGGPVALKIIAAARSRYLALGFRNVTMDDLAEELGMSKKTLYEHFPSKRALLETVLLSKFQEAEADLDRIAADLSPGVVPVLRRMLACMRMHAEEIRPAFIHDIRRKAPELFDLIQTRRGEALQRNFGRLITEGQKMGAIREDISSGLMVEILMSAVDSILNPTKLAELGISLKTGITAILSLLLEGAFTESGRSKA